MSDTALIRRQNLRRLCKARGWGPKDMALHTDATAAYWSNLLTDDNKSFGEKVARKTEHALELPRNWLDEEGHDVPAAPVVRAAEPPAGYIRAYWPFSADLHDAVMRLNAADLNACEDVIRAHLRLAGR